VGFHVAGGVVLHTGLELSPASGEISLLGCRLLILLLSILLFIVVMAGEGVVKGAGRVGGSGGDIGVAWEGMRRGLDGWRGGWRR